MNEHKHGPFIRRSINHGPSLKGPFPKNTGYTTHEQSYADKLRQRQLTQGSPTYQALFNARSETMHAIQATLKSMNGAIYDKPTNTYQKEGKTIDFEPLVNHLYAYEQIIHDMAKDTPIAIHPYLNEQDTLKRIKLVTDPDTRDPIQ